MILKHEYNQETKCEKFTIEPTSTFEWRHLYNMLSNLIDPLESKAISSNSFSIDILMSTGEYDSSKSYDRHPSSNGDMIYSERAPEPK